MRVMVVSHSVSMPPCALRRLRGLVSIAPWLIVTAVAAGGMPAAAEPTRGPLVVHASNPRYVAASPSPSEPAILLAGFHTWANVQDMGFVYPPPAFPWTQYLDLLASHNHTFARLWTWEQARGLDFWSGCKVGWDFWCGSQQTQLWERPGPGVAADGLPRFDVSKVNPAWLNRLRTRVRDASARGIYVSVMLFDGWSVGGYHHFSTGSWPGHPLHPGNNVNAAALSGLQNVTQAHAIGSPAQPFLDAYVRAVVVALNAEDNVVFEVCNENFGDPAWERRVVDVIAAAESSLPQRHLVWFSGGWAGVGNSSAQLLAPRPQHPPSWRASPPVSDGTKVVIADTDHLAAQDVWAAPITLGVPFVWAAFLRGNNVQLMDLDVADVDVFKRNVTPPQRALFNQTAPVRVALGQVATWSRRIDLAHVEPSIALSSTGFALVTQSASDDSGAGRRATGDGPWQALVGSIGNATSSFSVDTSGAGTRSLDVTWFWPAAGIEVAGPRIAGGSRVTLTPPAVPTDPAAQPLVVVLLQSGAS